MACWRDLASGTWMESWRQQTQNEKIIYTIHIIKVMHSACITSGAEEGRGDSCAAFSCAASLLPSDNLIFQISLLFSQYFQSALQKGCTPEVVEVQITQHQFLKEEDQHSTVHLRKVTSVGSNLASLTDLKEFKLHTVYAVISEAIKPLQLVGQAAEFKFEFKLEPCLLSGNLS